jgi:hypothetical protein
MKERQVQHETEAVNKKKKTLRSYGNNAAELPTVVKAASPQSHTSMKHHRSLYIQFWLKENYHVAVYVHHQIDHKIDMLRRIQGNVFVGPAFLESRLTE